MGILFSHDEIFVNVDLEKDKDYNENTSNNTDLIIKNDKKLKIDNSLII